MEWKVVTELFYEKMQGNGNIVIHTKCIEIIFVHTDFDTIRKQVDKIVSAYYSTCADHEIKSITKYKGEIFHGGKLL